ncbi:protein kinase [Streptacidiphilus sp. 4-A2]|nr:protein kinase [Streptacidiphilus sp. 4-A2]
MTSSPRPEATGGPAPQAARIGPYELLQLLGEGGMGQVYLARSPGARLVALKVIRPEYAQAPHFRDRFRREAEAARRVSGLFTPPVLDADADSPLPWLATAYVPAPSLHEVVRRHGPLSAPGIAALGGGLAEALSAIHAAGLVHRDLKPGNVLLAAAGPQVIDFGISKMLDATQLTGTDSTIGTPGFMAPEQVVSSRDVGREADVFALGCVLAFAATGESPFGTGSTAAVLYRVVHEQPRLDAVPESLRGLVTSCLEKEPARRPSVAGLLVRLGSTDPAELLTPALRADLAERQQRATLLPDAPPLPATVLATLPVTAALPDRRRFLRIAGAVAGTAAAAAGAAVWATTRTGTVASAGNSPAPKALSAGSTAPAGPSLVWQRELPTSSTNGRIAVLAGTLVHWDQSQAAGFDAAGGSPRWTAAPQLPAGESAAVTWLGVGGGALFGAATSDTGYLLALDGNGRQLFVHPVTQADSSGFASPVNQLFAVGAGIALVGVDGDSGFQLLAVDLTGGQVLWTRQVTSSMYSAVTDGQRCYLQDGTDTYALDLRTGRSSWHAQGTGSSGDEPGLSLAPNILLVTDNKVQAVDTATGTRLWTAVNESDISATLTNGGAAFVADDSGTVFGLNSLSGKQNWSTVTSLDLFVDGAKGVSQNISLSQDLLVLSTGSHPGLVALRPTDGRLLWAHQDTSGPAGQPWAVLASGALAFAASDTTLYAYRSPTS